MQVGDGLSRRFSDIGHQAPPTFEPLRGGNRGGEGNEVGEHRRGHRLSDRTDVLFRDDEDVGWSHRVDIAKCQGVLRPFDDVSR